MAGSHIPEKLINFKAYKDGTNLLGVVDVEFSGGELLAESISGAGIAGELDSQTLGHTSPIAAKVNFRARTKATVALTAQQSHQLEFRGSQQVREPGGAYKTIGERIVIKGTPKSSPLGGKYEVGKPLAQEIEFAVDYVKIEIDGQEVFEHDKINFIYAVNGVDYLQSVRADLGM